MQPIVFYDVFEVSEMWRKNGKNRRLAVRVVRNAGKRRPNQSPPTWLIPVEAMTEKSRMADIRSVCARGRPARDERPRRIPPEPHAVVDQKLRWIRKFTDVVP
jgi:hypothetical protein